MLRQNNKNNGYNCCAFSNQKQYVEQCSHTNITYFFDKVKVACG